MVLAYFFSFLFYLFIYLFFKMLTSHYLETMRWIKTTIKLCLHLMPRFIIEFQSNYFKNAIFMNADIIK